MGDKVKWRDAKALRDRIEELEAENKLLLEALEVMTERQSLYSGGHDDDIIAKARAAIKKAKGEE